MGGALHIHYTLIISPPKPYAERLNNKMTHIITTATQKKNNSQKCFEIKIKLQATKCSNTGIFV